MLAHSRVRVAVYATFAIACVAVAAYAGMAALARPRDFSAHFYFWLRITVCAWALLTGALAYDRFRNPSFLAFLGLAVLFNPVRPIFLSKGLWSVIDLGVAVLSVGTLMLCLQQLRKVLADR